MNPTPLAPLALLARDEEQRVLDAAIAGLGEGRGQVVLLAGQPGIGKSSLARWAVRRAGERGIAASWGYCWEAGRAPPYWPWTQCLRTVLAERTLGPEDLRHAKRLLPELDTEPRPDSQLRPDQARFQLLESARSVMRAIARSGPLVAVLEDLHAADYDSLLLMQFLCPMVAELPILLVGTFRESEARLSQDASPLWQCARNAIVLRPRPFGPAEVEALLSETASAAPAARLVDRVLALTEGNPLFVSELLRILRHDPSGALPASLPDSLQQVIRQHLDTVPRNCRARLEEAAILGREFDLGALADLAGITEPEALQALQPALAADLVRTAGTHVFRFTHIFYREVLYAGTGADRRMSLHQARAATLKSALATGLPAHWSDLAEHLSAAGPRNRAAAAGAWRRAAIHARERRALTEACDLYRRAVESFGAGPGADPVERCDYLLEWARAELEAGQIEPGRSRCIEVFDLAESLDSPSIMARAALTYGSVFVVAKVDPVLVRLLRHALDALNADDTGLQARLQARLAAALQPADDPAVPIAMAREAVRRARDTGDDAVLFETLGSAISALMDFAPVGERTELNREFAERATARENITAEFRAHSLLAIDAVEGADAAALERAISALERLARQLELPHYDWRVASALALQAQTTGDLESALDHHGRAVQFGRHAGDELAEMTLEIQGFSLKSDAGNLDRRAFDELRQRIQRACANLGADDLFVRPLYARYLLRQGDRNAALAVCSAGAVERLIQMRELSNIAVIGDCAALSGDLELARRVVSVLAPHADICSHAGLYGMSWNGPVALTLGRLYRLLGEEDEAAAAFQTARSVATRLGATQLFAVIDAEAAGHDDPKPAPAPGTSAPVTGPADPIPVLVADGEIYRLAFRGRQVLLQPTRGMEWLERLIAEPGREWHVLDLAGDPEAPRDPTDSGPLLDRQARDAYRRRLEAIPGELEEADGRRDEAMRDRLLEEQTLLQRELGRAFGLGGRDRPAGKAAERARVNVTRRLRDAIRRISEQHPEAGNYLDKTVKTGRYCSFNPV